MVKKASFVLIAVLFVVSTGFCRPNITFQGMGGGGHGTFAVISENHFARDDFTGGFGLRGIVELRLGNFGLVHYTPSLTFWLPVGSGPVTRIPDIIRKMTKNSSLPMPTAMKTSGRKRSLIQPCAAMPI